MCSKIRMCQQFLYCPRPKLRCITSTTRCGCSRFKALDSVNEEAHVACVNEHRENRPTCQFSQCLEYSRILCLGNGNRQYPLRSTDDGTLILLHDGNRQNPAITARHSSYTMQPGHHTTLQAVCYLFHRCHAIYDLYSTTVPTSLCEVYEIAV
jgi:hypothetical protein